MKREIEEATNMTPEEMNLAAREIIRQSQHIDPEDLEAMQRAATPQEYDGSPRRYTPSPRAQHEMQERNKQSPSPDSVDKHSLVNKTTSL